MRHCGLEPLAGLGAGSKRVWADRELMARQERYVENPRVEMPVLNKSNSAEGNSVKRER